MRWSCFVGQFGGRVKVYSDALSCRQRRRQAMPPNHIVNLQQRVDLANQFRVPPRGVQKPIWLVVDSPIRALSRLDFMRLGLGEGAFEAPYISKDAAV